MDNNEKEQKLKKKVDCILNSSNDYNISSLLNILFFYYLYIANASMSCVVLFLALHSFEIT